MIHEVKNRRQERFISFARRKSRIKDMFLKGKAVIKLYNGGKT